MSLLLQYWHQYFIPFIHNSSHDHCDIVILLSWASTVPQLPEGLEHDQLILGEVGQVLLHVPLLFILFDIVQVGPLGHQDKSAEKNQPPWGLHQSNFLVVRTKSLKDRHFKTFEHWQHHLVVQRVLSLAAGHWLLEVDTGQPLPVHTWLRVTPSWVEFSPHLQMHRILSYSTIHTHTKTTVRCHFGLYSEQCAL